MVSTHGAAGSATVANGAALIRLGPVPPHRVWQIDGYALASTGLTEGRCFVHVNSVADNTVVDTTYDAVQNNSGKDITLMPGETILFRYANCVPNGAVVRANIRYSVG